MSKSTPPPRPPKQQRSRQTPQLPRGGTSKLVAAQVAAKVSDAVAGLYYPRGTGHLRHQLVRAADAVETRLSEANARTWGNRRVHLEAAYGEAQETKTLVDKVLRRGIVVPHEIVQQIDRMCALTWGLLRAELRHHRT